MSDRPKYLRVRPDLNVSRQECIGAQIKLFHLSNIVACHIKVDLGTLAEFFYSPRAALCLSLGPKFFSLKIQQSSIYTNA